MVISGFVVITSRLLVAGAVCVSSVQSVYLGAERGGNYHGRGLLSVCLSLDRYCRHDSVSAVQDDVTGV